MTDKKIIVSTEIKTRIRKEKPIDWATASEQRLLSIAMNTKTADKADTAIETLIERGFVFTRKQASRLINMGRITSDNIA